MTPYQVYTVMKAKWKLAASILALTVVTTMIVTFFLPKQYTAKASVLVDIKSPDPIAGMVLPGLMSPSYMATQVDIINSEKVANKVIQAMGLTNVEQLREQWSDDTQQQGSFESWLADMLHKKLDVRPSRESSVINISYESTDPRFSAALANAFVKAYIDATIELRADPARNYSTLFGAQAQELRKRLETAQRKLSDYEQAHGLIATDERLDIETARLAELSSQHVALQSVAADSSSRRRTANDNSAEVLANPVVSSLSAELVRQEAKLKELGATLGASHPQVQQLQENTRELRARLSTETARVKSSLGVSDTVNSSRLAQAKSALEAQRQSVLKMKTQRDEAAVLMKDVMSAQAALDAVQVRFNQTDLEKQSTQTNVSILQDATPPSEKSSPRVWLNLALSIVGGLAIATSVALGGELLNRKVRSAYDILNDIDVPILATFGSVNISGTDGNDGTSQKRLTGQDKPKRLTAA